MVSAEATIVGVLRLLKGNGGKPLSGQSISDALKISRTAVWKQIARLKEMGFDISSSRARGYTLAEIDGPFNGVEVLSGLNTDFVAQEISFYDELVSTNITANELAVKGAVEGAAVIADAQTGGKGRLGRNWLSPPGSNLYTSIILRPECAPLLAPPLTLVFAVAAAEAIEAFVSKAPSVKWPNDILIDSKKVAGILLEMNADIDRVNHVVCGIGVNINSSPQNEKGPGLNATSLSDISGAVVSRTAFARTLYSSVEKWYKVYLVDGFISVAEAWRGYFSAEGKPISIKALDRNVEGICMGIDETGALLVREASGRVSTVTSGDMALS